MLEAVLDTGSEVSLIKEGVVRQLDLTQRNSRDIPQLHGVSGRKLRVLGSVNTTITVSGNTLDTKLIVVPDHYLQTPVLLGMNVLGRIKLTIDSKKGMLMWNEVVFPLKYQEHHYGKVKVIQTDISDNESKRVTNFVRLTSKIRLTPHVTSLIEAKVDETPQNRVVVTLIHPCSPKGLPHGNRDSQSNHLCPCTKYHQAICHSSRWSLVRTL